MEKVLSVTHNMKVHKTVKMSKSLGSGFNSIFSEFAIPNYESINSLTFVL